MELTLGTGDMGHPDYKVNLIPKTFTLKSLANHIQSVSGTKEKARLFFVRGNADYRSDDSMQTAVLIVIDADSSFKDVYRAPNPKTVHQLLTGNGINHLIYPSYSNGEKIKGRKSKRHKRKWRLVIPCQGIDGKKTLKAVTNIIYAVLQNKGIHVPRTMESFVLSQAWYITKPIKSKYHDWYLLNTKGKYLDVKRDFKPDHLTDPSMQITSDSRKPGARPGMSSGNGVSVQAAMENLGSGDNLHPSLVVVMGNLRSKGYEYDEAHSMVVATLVEYGVWNIKGNKRMQNIDRELADIWKWLTAQ